MFFELPADEAHASKELRAFFTSPEWIWYTPFRYNNSLYFSISSISKKILRAKSISLSLSELKYFSKLLFKLIRTNVA